MNTTLASFTDVLTDEICNSQPMSLPSSVESRLTSLSLINPNIADARVIERPAKGTGQRGQFRSTEEIDPKYRDVFSYPYFNLVQSSVIEDALYSDQSIVVCAPTGSGKTVVFEMAIVQLLMELEEKQYNEDFKIIYMAPVKALCTERLTEWYSKFTKLGLLCIEVTGDTDVDFTQLKPYKIIITTPEKWDMLTRRWRDHRSLVEVIKLFLIDEVHILNDEVRGPVLEAVVSRMKTIENSAQSVHRIEQLQKQMQGQTVPNKSAPRIRFVAVSATVSNPEDVANWLGTSDKPAVIYKFGDECRPVKLKRVVEGYPCPEGTSIFKFDIILNYKLWPVIQKYHSGKPTLIFCNTRKSVILTAETLSRELTISFNAEQKAKLTAVASTIKNKKLQALVMSGVGCHHAGLLYEERQNIEFAFRNRDLPILITTTTLAMGVNLPAHLVIVKNTQQYVRGAYQEYSISTVLQMVGRAGRPQFDTEATAVIMTRLVDKPRYQALVGGCEPLQSFLHKRLAENLNSEAALGTVGDVAQCVQWLRSTFLYVRAARDPKKYLGLPQNSPQQLISKKIEELCVKAMNGLASSGLITMDEASCIESTEAGRLMSIFYLDLETMKHIMKIEGSESLERLLVLICESHELAYMHLRVDERRCLNTLNRNNAAATIRFPMKGKISTRQMKLNCIIQAVLGCLSIPDPSLNQEAMKIMRIADRVCRCLVIYVTRPDLISCQPQFYTAVLNSIILAKCVTAHLWENSPFVSKQLKGIGTTFSTLLASAGKVNFMLLEESHPRDLERIMNKGAPAGNVLRKQVSLLPKYQLTMKPVDEKTVTVQLVLLNQSHLAENMESLTAGDNHKSYIIVGDSENHLLLLVAFKDKDLISVYDGTITHEVKRKQNVEHKVIAHCVSSSFVGIDVQSEYVFNNLDQFFRGSCQDTSNKIVTPAKKIAERQTCITDTFKERKRKNTDAIDKTQSKEKKKRENALIENFKYLKESIETASKNIKQSQHQLLLSRKVDSSPLPNNTKVPSNNVSYSENPGPVNDNINTWPSKNNCMEDVDSDEFIDDEKIDSILNEIENEMCKSKESIDKSKTLLNNNNMYFRRKNINSQNPFSSKFKTDVLKNSLNKDFTKSTCSYKTVGGLNKRKLNTKSNYNFIDLLERNLNLSDEENKTVTPQKDNGFSDTIKSQIQKYLTKTQNKANVSDRRVEMLIENSQNKPLNEDDNDDLPGVNLMNTDNEKTVNPIDEPYPQYEIKEILGGKYSIEQKNNIQQTEKINEENLEPLTISNVTNIEKQNKHNDVDLTHSDANAEIIQISNKATILLDDYWVSKINSDKNHKPVQNNLSEIGSINADKCDFINICSPETDRIEIKCNEINDNICNNIMWIDKNSNNCRDINENNIESVKSIVPSEISIDNPKARNHHINELYVNPNTKENSSNEICIHTGEGNSKKDFPNLYESNNKRTLAKVPHLDIVPRNYRNPLIENNRSSHSETLMIEDGDHNEHVYQLQNNKSICKPFVPNYMSSPYDSMSDTQNNSSVFSKDTCKQKAEFIRRYTYSTNKIDICTKQTPEYCVQVIKKVKMDLDITAIVSRKHNSFQNYKSDCQEPPKSRQDLKCIELPQPQNTFQNSTRDAHKIATTVNNEIQNISEVNLQLAIKAKSEFSKIENFEKELNTDIRDGYDINNLRVKKDAITFVSKSNDKNNANDKQDPDILREVGKFDENPNKDADQEICHINNLRIESDEIKPHVSKTNDERNNAGSIQNPEMLRGNSKELNNLNFNCENTSKTLEQVECEDNPANGVNKIKNILNKYSKILGKTAGKPVTPNSTGINRSQTFNDTPTIKLQKPFKITDIHKLFATLPTTIIEPKPATEKPVVQFPNVNDNLKIEMEHGDLHSGQYVKCTETMPTKETITIPKYEYITDFDIEPIHLPADVDLEPPKDLDQSMFDPKTLLQCAVDEGSYEIVPPPPEFSDDITFSPGYKNTGAIMAENNYSQCYTEPRVGMSTEKDMEYNESIFDDPCATDLTPSREIETWNLSCDDIRESRNSTNLSPAKSFTLMRKNTNNGSYFSQSSVMSRKARLGKYKFSHKNKLKIRK